MKEKILVYNDIEYVLLKSMDYAFGISKEGEVIKAKNKRILRQYIGSDCYQHITLCYKGKKYRKRVHRLMAEAFLDNCKYVDHIDDCKYNNTLDNLRPITNKENVEKGMKDAKNYHGNVGWFKSVKVKSINKETKEEVIHNSMRQCERFTGVDRHRIKTFLRKERSNYTNYDFELLQ